MLSENPQKAVKEFKRLNETEENMDFSLSDRKKPTDEQIRRKIIKITKTEPKGIAAMPKEERNRNLAVLRRSGLSIGQLERLTGISRGIISRI